jgi:hypothetical protein
MKCVYNFNKEAKKVCGDVNLIKIAQNRAERRTAAYETFTLRLLSAIVKKVPKVKFYFTTTFLR